jgi:hypothetical protein
MHLNLEALESRRLLATVSVADYGAIPNDGVDDWLAISNASLDRNATTIQFPAGVYDVGNTLTFRAGKTYDGLGGATLKFDIGNRLYGGVMFKDSSDITVKGLKFDGGGISMSAGSKYTRINIINNEITRTRGTAGIFASIPSQELIVEGNKIHNFSGWGAILWHMNEGSFSKNKLCAITQGAHILAPKHSNEVSFNVGRHLTRMGIEMQAHNRSLATDTTVEGNVFYDWKLPYRDSFGLSIVPDNSLNTKIINNYLSANHTGDWNPEAYSDGQGQRYGYGIEAGFATGVVEGNVIGGPFANHIVVSHRDTMVRNNKMYGVPKWRNYIASEGGPNGSGSWIDGGGNVMNRNFASMPAHNAEDPCAGLPGGGNPTPNPNPNPGGVIVPPSHLVARALGPSTVDLSWRDNSNNEAGFRIERSYFGAEGPFVQVAQVPINVVKWTNYGVLANKTMWYRVRAYGAIGQSVYSAVVEVKTPAFGGLAGGPATGGGALAGGGLSTGFGGRTTGTTGTAAGGIATGLTGGLASRSTTDNPFSDLLI